jgi:hypothetical protein
LDARVCASLGQHGGGNNGEEGGLAADAVGDAAKDGPRHELAEGEARGQGPDHQGGRSEPSCVEGEQRKDQREPQHVDEDRQEDGEQGRAEHGSEGTGRAPRRVSRISTLVPCQDGRSLGAAP